MREKVLSGIEQLLNEEALASEANPDAPLAAHARVSRPNQTRSTVYSIRLNPDEVADLHALAEQAGVPASTLARAWIAERIRDERVGVSDMEADLRAAQRHLTHLEQQLRHRAS